MTQAILAGFLIGIGDIALISASHYYMGAFLFSVALMSIIYFELPLYTGAIGRVVQDKDDIPGCIIALILNTVGATFAVWLFTLTNPQNLRSVDYMADLKFNKSFLALFILGVFCNVLIHLASSTKHTIIVILCIMTFIICGFEHSIADVPYALLSFSWHNLLAWLCILAGNTVGGIATSWMLTFMDNAWEKRISKQQSDEDFDSIERPVDPLEIKEVRAEDVEPQPAGYEYDNKIADMSNKLVHMMDYDDEEDGSDNVDTESKEDN